MKITSYFFHCKVTENFEKTQMEQYEVENGMEAKWVNIFEAIEHNQKVLQKQDSTMGFSINRETFIFNFIVNQILRK